VHLPTYVDQLDVGCLATDKPRIAIAYPLKSFTSACTRPVAPHQHHPLADSYSTAATTPRHLRVHEAPSPLSPWLVDQAVEPAAVNDAYLLRLRRRHARADKRAAATAPAAAGSFVGCKGLTTKISRRNSGDGSQALRRRQPSFSAAFSIDSSASSSAASSFSSAFTDDHAAPPLIPDIDLLDCDCPAADELCVLAESVACDCAEVGEAADEEWAWLLRGADSEEAGEGGGRVGRWEGSREGCQKEARGWGWGVGDELFGGLGAVVGAT
jgi:hypothetical protein